MSAEIIEYDQVQDTYDFKGNFLKFIRRVVEIAEF